MLAFEHSRRQQFVDSVYDLEQSVQAPYPGLTMDTYDPVDAMVNFHPLPYSYFENPSIFTTAPVQSLKQEMHQFHDLPPALISSGSVPSIPSASSSTVGSPYSAPSHTISSQDSYDHNGVSYGLGVMPTIVNHEAFSQEMLGGTAMEAELSIDKLSDTYVGECADLSSSQHHPSNVPLSVAQSVQPPSISFIASPEVLSINTGLDPPASTVPSIPSSLHFSSSVTHSPVSEQTRATSIFKSPTTPASARSRHSTTAVSPFQTRPLPQSSSSRAAPRHASFRVPHAFHPSSRQPPAGRFQSHFFAQSSGNFLPPLESSCSSLPPCSSVATCFFHFPFPISV